MNNQKYKNRNRKVLERNFLVYVEYPEAGADKWICMTYDTYREHFLKNIIDIKTLAIQESIKTTQDILDYEQVLIKQRRI